MKILVTGSAGFIGFHVVKKLLQLGHVVVGIDNVNDYYDTGLKYARLKELGIYAEGSEGMVASKTIKGCSFNRMAIEDRVALPALFAEQQFDAVVNLAAQAGVRYSLQNPFAYVDSNISGFVNLLECCRYNEIKHFIYASSSSVYGLNGHDRFSTGHNVDHPISLYAATKKSNELMAHVYSHLFGLPTTGLRFFTVYGPWGRPDMALFLFTKAILENKPIEVFNHGQMERDFTYVDDIVNGVIGVLQHVPAGNPGWDALNPDPSSAKAPYKVYNIGNNKPVKLLDFITAIENSLGKKAIKKMMPIQPGDVVSTCADISDLAKDTGYQPEMSVEEGVNRFVKWYVEYYAI